MSLLDEVVVNSIYMDEMPGAKEARKAYRRAYGVTRFGEWWARYARPLLFPVMNDEIVFYAELQRDKMQTTIINILIRDARE